MSLFAVLSPSVNPKLESAIIEKFPDNHFKINSTQWVVSGKGSAKIISDTIGITSEGDATIGSGVVLAFSGYWGRASTDLWEWMKAKIEASDNG